MGLSKWQKFLLFFHPIKTKKFMGADGSWWIEKYKISGGIRVFISRNKIKED